MGDRCYCTLTLSGILQKEHISLLAGAINGADPADYSKTIKGLAQLEANIANGQASFDFQDVNYAQMDDDLKATCESLRLSYVWFNEAGDEYEASETYYDARTGEHPEYNLVNGSIGLTLDEIDMPGALEKARHWRDFGKSMIFFVAASNHDLLATEGYADRPQGYLELLAGIDLSDLE